MAVATSRRASSPPALRTADLLKDLPVADIIERLKSSKLDLSSEEATRCLEQYGYNELPQEHQSALVIFLSYFRGAIPYMIMAAAIISAVLGRYQTLVIILVLPVMNAVAAGQGR